MKKTMLSVLALSLSVLLPIASSSAITTEPLVGEVLFGPAAGETATGSFTYDETLLTGVGSEELGVADGLLIDFTFVGMTFTEADDTDFDAFPLLTLFDGVPDTLDFVVLDGDGVGTDIGDPRFEGFGIFPLDPLPTGGFFVDINTIPEPASMALFGLGLTLVGARRRRRK